MATSVQLAKKKSVVALNFYCAVGDRVPVVAVTTADHKVTAQVT